MAEFPALPLYTDAYLGDTRHLGAAQHGAYLLLLMTAWRSGDCALHDDDDILAKCAAMDRRTWLKNKSIIFSETLRWKLGSDRKWRQSRLTDERKRAEHVRDRQVQGGLASALKRKETNSRHLPSDLPAIHQPPSPSPSPLITTDSKLSVVPPTPSPEIIDDQPKPEMQKNVRSREPKKRAVQIADDFQPDFAALGLCDSLGVDPVKSSREFIDYWRGVGKPMSDWQAVFRNRVRQIADYRAERAARAPVGRPGAMDITGTALRVAEARKARKI